MRPALLLPSITALVAISSISNAATIARDSYLVGNDASNNNAYDSSKALTGQYDSTKALKSQPSTLVNQGFVNGAYASGSGTANFGITAGGLTSSVLYDYAGGAVTWLGLGSADATNRSVARNLSTTQNLTTYYTAQLVNRGSDGTTAPVAGAFVGEGFANSAAPTGGVSTSGSATTSLTGFYVGFAGTGGSDFGSLVIRSRTTLTTYQNADTVLVNGASTSTANNTYLVITKAEANYTGGSVDRLTYWVNPTDTSSESAMSNSSLATGNFDFYGLQLGGDLARLNYADSPVASTSNGTAATFAASSSFTGTAYFDEVRLGVNLADVTATPEPTTLAALAGAGSLLLRRRR